MIARRLPGFRFEVQPPAPTVVLPRMDVAMFVGFAATGPLNQPVAVEDVAQFNAVFGEDAPLAWDPIRGEQVYAYLAPAVRAFFRNGGVRCWVVRVAGNAQYNVFPILGMARVRLDRNGAVDAVEPALIKARSAGSWSDDWRVAAALLSQSLRLRAPLPDPTQPELELATPGFLAVGDWLRITFRQDGEARYVLMYSVKALKDAGPRSPLSAPGEPGRLAVKVQSDKPLWFRVQPPFGSPMADIPGFARLTAATSGPVSPSAGAGPATLKLSETLPEGAFSLGLHFTPSTGLAPGSLVQAEFSGERLWLVVDEVRQELTPTSPPTQNLVVTGRGLWRLETPPPVGDLIASAEKLTFQLLARQGEGYQVQLSDLAFAAQHPRFWGAAPTDDELYPARYENLTQQRPIDAYEHQDDPAWPYAALWRAVTDPRFPLAGEVIRDGEHYIYFPLAIPTLPDQYLAPIKSPATPLERDGLQVFNADLFLDCRLSDFGVRTLIEQANFLRYQADTPHVPTGIYTALELEEVTLIAAPDSVHRGWTQEVPMRAPSSPPSPPPSSPLLSPPESDTCHEPDFTRFFECGLVRLVAPLLSHDGPDEQGNFTLSWEPDERSKTYTVVEVVGDEPPQIIYQGADTRLTIYGRSHGNYYYRVQAQAGASLSGWSLWDEVTIGGPGQWQLKPAEEFTPLEAFRVQRALVQLCAARGDMLAILSMPEHYREDEAILHVTSLRSLFEPLSASITVNTGGLKATGYGEQSALSYSAIYHPWLIGREESRPTELRRTPPDGAACGLIAYRARTRGAWVAPANEELRGISSMTPPIRERYWLRLQDAQINLIRHEPHGFVCLNSDTLASADDVDLRPINVRRLLILLRRLALQEGVTYVFEPNSDSFRRLVQRRFEAVMQYMFMRGAFAGNRPDNSYQVITSTTVNTRQSTDLGRLIVELRVAPSLPMTFLTVRLVQSGDRGIQVEGR